MDVVTSSATETDLQDVPNHELDSSSGIVKHLNNSTSYATYGIAGSTDTVVTAIGSQGQEQVDHSELPIMDEDGAAMLVTAAPQVVGEEAEGDGDAVMMADPARQTITLSLDEAAQYLLQHQGMATQAIEMEDGTYQLFEQPVIQVQREDGTLEAQTLHVEVLQALQGELVQQLQPSLDVGYPLEDDDERTLATAEPEASDAAPDKREVDEDRSVMIENEEESQNFSTHESDSILKELKKEVEDVTAQAEPEEDSQESGKSSESAVKVAVSGQTAQAAETVKGEKTAAKTAKKEATKKEADFANPIPLSNQTIITVNGKKCVLQYDAKSQQVCAYPIKNGKRRGRPRLSEAEKVASRQRKMQQQMELASSSGYVAAPSEKSSAAETLLELSNTGSGGIRRSGRARKKVQIFEDFEELEDSEEDDSPAFKDNPEKDPDISLELPEAKRKRLMAPKKDHLSAPSGALSGLLAPTAKRGRGRPRRYPLPGQQNPPKSIPAVMLPSADGQTLVMAPIQDFQNLQHIRRQLPQLIPKPPSGSEASGADTSSVPSAPEEGADHQGLTLACSEADSLPLDASAVLDSSSIIPQALQGDSIPLVGDAVDSSDQGDGLDTSPSSLLNLMSGADSDKPKAGDVSDSQPQPTVIQIPDNLLASLGFKKDPIKIGLKASERELEKLKCPKCDFQGYYTQQYRNHIATHGDDIQKCKCCSFLSLDGDELLQHFKEYHPRCICTECGYMAEHAYIIKRHMMRHDVKSCTCSVCGKVYKDMYILKMHIKMVHMPAEVLFECDVCSKKFTRKAHLKRHMRIHEPEKPYKCDICDYRGCERSDISKHMLIHQEPKHVCERCGKTFRHIKNKELHVKRHYGQRDYKCGVCDFFGYTFTDIRKHIERKHQDIKTLICDKCGRHFRNEMALKEHLQTCNMMMIEQVLAIPTSGGRTSQATIRIPTHHLGSLGGVLALDAAGSGGVVAVEGSSAEDAAGAVGQVAAAQGVGIMVSSTAGGEQHLGLVEAQPMGEEEEEEEEELEEEEDQEGSGQGSSMQQAMHLIERTIIRQDGEAGVHHHILDSSSAQILSPAGGHTTQPTVAQVQGLPQSHLLGQGAQRQQQHYVTTSSGLHLISSSVAGTVAASAGTIIAMAGDDAHSQQQGDTTLYSQQQGDTTLYSEQQDGTLPTKIEARLVSRGEVEGLSAASHHPLIAVEGEDHGGGGEGNTQILVSMEEWNAATTVTATQEGGFHGSDAASSATGQDS